MPNIELLDGGFLYELNKRSIDNNIDWGENIINNDIDQIIDIYMGYINIGCKYITSGNYVFKPNRNNNWELYTEILVKTLYDLKINNDFILLGCIPPYFESYNNKILNEEAILFYNKLKIIMEKYADKFIIETMVSYNNINEICKIFDNSLPIIISIYPNDENDISYIELELLLGKYNIEGILINCCDYDSMKKYFDNCISKIKNDSVKFGFYLNKIDEQAYKKSRKISINNGDIDNENLQNYYIEDNSDNKKINEFINNYKLKNDLIIGGCCGYGIDEMILLNNILKIKN
tara:strand:- start:6964 stop:7836 length:873 start_codon:yes stop_codon:yes gene_type:complete